MKDFEKYRQKSEYEHQVCVFKWAEKNFDKWPELRLLEGSLNGVRLNIGQIKKLKKAGGFKKGRPDIHLPVPHGGYASLFIELKKLNGRVSEYQKDYQLALKHFGNYVCVCRGDKPAIRILTKYLKGKIKK